MLRYIEIQNRSIIDVKAECIVNSISHDMHGGGTICSAIFSAAGPQLKEACKRIGECDEDSAVVTESFDLNKRGIKHIIHTVTPVWQNTSHMTFGPLKNCYYNSLLLAKKMDCHSVAFPLLGVGNHGCPKDIGLMLSMQGIADFLDMVRIKEPDYPIHVLLVISDKSLLEMAYKKQIAYASDYVKNTRIGMTFEEFTSLAQSLITIGDVKKLNQRNTIIHILQEVLELNRQSDLKPYELYYMETMVKNLDKFLSRPDIERYRKHPKSDYASNKRLQLMQQSIRTMCNKE